MYHRLGNERRPASAQDHEEIIRGEIGFDGLGCEIHMEALRALPRKRHGGAGGGDGPGLYGWGGRRMRAWRGAWRHRQAAKESLAGRWRDWEGEGVWRRMAAKRDDFAGFA